MKQNKRSLKIAAIVFCLIAVMTLSACGKGGTTSGGTSSGGSGSGTVSYAVEGYERTDGVVDTTKRDDGRYVDGYQIAFLNDTVSTAWFDFTVKSVEFVNEYDGYTPDDGYNYAVAEITVKNTFGEDIDIYYNDFYLAYNLGNDTDVEYAEEKAAYKDGENIGNSFVLANGQTATFDFIFQISSDAVGNYAVDYMEYYSDEVAGNEFIIVFE